MFESISKYPFVLLVGLLVSFLLTPLVIRFARQFGMVDRPDERRIHTGIIPRGGGLAIFAGFHVACAAIYFLPWFPFEITLSYDWWLTFLPVSLFIVFVGVVDDRWGIKPYVKLGCQIVAALALYYMGIDFGSLFDHPLPRCVDCALTVFWFVGFMNAFNLIDGLDGLATGLGIIAAVGVAGSFILRHLPGDALVLLGLIGACLGFLRYNFNPACVFLGDAGSMFIGLTLAVISVSTGSKGTMVASMAIPLLAAGVPILDTTLAIWRRSVRRLRNTGAGNGSGHAAVFLADKDHLHHRLLRTGQSHRKVAYTLYLVNGALVVMGLLSLAFQSFSITIYLLGFVVAVYVIVRHLAHVELWSSGVAVLNGLRRPSSKVVAVIVYPLVDLAIMGVALLPALYMPCSDAYDLKTLWLDHAVLWVCIPFIFLAASGTYMRVWSRARLYEYVMLVTAFTGGAFVATALSAMLGSSFCRRETIEAILFWVFSLVGIVGVRLFSRVVQDSMPFLLCHQAIEGVERVPCLVYGAGYGCMLFFKDKTNDEARQTTQQVVVGLLDDDTNLHGRTVCGYRVLGGLERLEDSVRKYGVQELVITTRLAEAVFQEVERIAEAHQIRVFRWRVDIRLVRHEIAGEAAGGHSSKSTTAGSS